MGATPDQTADQHHPDDGTDLVTDGESNCVPDPSTTISNNTSDQEVLTVDMLIWAYSNGVFPMANHRHGHVQWYAADPRAVLPLDQFQASASLRKRVKRSQFDIRYDTAFRQTIENCAMPRRYEGDTWINDQIIDSFCQLHDLGLAHSVEAWQKVTCTSAPQDDTNPDTHTDTNNYQLVGGLYGVSLGGAFFGESMFSKTTDASKVCLVHLVEHLNKQNYALLDVQMNSEHMTQFGTLDIAQTSYMEQLTNALPLEVEWGDPYSTQTEE